MFQVRQIYEGEFEEKGSKFLSFLVPFNFFASTLEDLKQNHLKAVHFVYATRTKNLQIDESFSDDGEPRGSSGVPTLNVLRGEKLINIGLITVRYFGGTLLGVGGLVRAYTRSAQSAIEKAKSLDGLFLYEEEEFCFKVSYGLLEKVKYWIEKLQITLIHQEFEFQEVTLSLRATKQKKKEFLQICHSKLGIY